MARKITLHALALTFLLTPLCAAAGEVAWPPLDRVAHIQGRAASEADVAKGNAVFALGGGGKAAGKPIKIQIPQYALHVDADTGKKTPVVLIQAEEGRGTQIAGYINVRTGERAIDLLSTLQLLGTAPAR